MIKPYVMMAAVLLCALSPAPVIAAAPDAAAAARIASACTAGGAFGETYGANLLTGAPGRRGADVRWFTPKTNYTPFTMFAALLTPNSERVGGVMATADLRDSQSAVDWAKLILKATGQDPEALFEERPGKFIAELSPNGPRLEVRNRSIELTCLDARQLETADKELADKPRPPHHNAPVTPSPNVCDRPESRAAFLASIDQTLAVRGDDHVELVVYVQRMQGWAVQQRDVEVPESWWLASNTDPAIVAAMTRMKNAFAPFEAARDRHDDASTCTSAVAVLQAADETYGAFLSFLDARLVKIAAMPSQSSPPSP
jgi:hypothetical protein